MRPAAGAARSTAAAVKRPWRSSPRHRCRGAALAVKRLAAKGQQVSGWAAKGQQVSGWRRRYNR
ncbi:hypothetical protein [Amycolatopsis sp. NBC_00438]|uniref:hypothetical protein n=1 Tax=Amycolatopsis sp. NBC_00438 TaxID=2903558 RepID=UPI002E1B8262